MTYAIEKLARRLRRLEKRVDGGLNQPQLGSASIEDGSAMEAYDDFDQLTTIIGRQPDGTNGVTNVSGPVPPTPVAPVVTSEVGGFTVEFTGYFVDDAVAPMDFERVDIHYGVPGFDASISSPRGSITSPRGGKMFFPGLSTVTYEVSLITRTTAGVGSVQAEHVQVTPSAILSDADVAAIAQAAQDALDAGNAAIAAAALAQAAGDAAQAAGDAAQADADAAQAAADAAQADADAAQATGTAAGVTGAAAQADADAAQAAADAAQADADAAQATGTAAAATGSAAAAAAAAAQAAADGILPIDTADISSGAVTTTKIAAGAITANEVAANAITAAKILAGSIVAGKLAANAVVAGTVDADVVTAREIAASTVTAAEIAANTITAGQIAANTITAAKIAAATITAAEIAAGTITATQIAANTITAAKITAGTITAAEIAANTITAAKIAANTITAAQIAANTITAAQIAANTITAAQIAADTITAAQIAAGTISAAEIAANTITAAEMSSEYVYAGSVEANQITAGVLNAALTLAARISTRVGNEGAGLDIDNISGLQLFDSDGVRKVHLPTDWTDPDTSALFSGTLIAEVLSILVGTTLRGDIELAREGVAVMSANTTSPATQLVGTVDWEAVSLDTTAGTGASGEVVGINTPVCRNLVKKSSTEFLTIQLVKSDGGAGVAWYRIWVINPTTGGVTVHMDVSLPSGSTDAGIYYDSVKNYVVCYKNSGIIHFVSANAGSVGTQFAQISQFAGGYDQVGYGDPASAGSIALFESNGTTNKIRIINLTTGAASGTITPNNSLPSNDVAGVHLGSFDFGASRWVFAPMGSGNFMTCTTAAAQQVNEEWPPAGTATIRGFCWDGSRFVQLGNDGTLYFFTDLTWTSGSAKWQFGATYYDSDVNGVPKDVINKALTSNVATLTTDEPHDLHASTDVVTVAGVDATFNGSFTVTSTPTPTTFTYAKTASNVASTAITGATVTATDSVGHETDIGPLKAFTMKKRARLTLTYPVAIPDYGGVDDADSLMIYGARSDTILDRVVNRTSLKKIAGSTAGNEPLPPGVNTLVIDDWTTVDSATLFTGNPPPDGATNPYAFPLAANPFELQSTNGGFSIDGNADGSMGTAGFARSARPPGEVTAYAGSSAPAGWLICNGASVLRSDYPYLFAAIGTTYGTADSTHFNIPDARNRTVVGAHTAGFADFLGDDEGETSASARTPGHTHGIPNQAAHDHGAGSLTSNASSNTSTGGAAARAINPITGTTGTGGSHAHGGNTDANSGDGINNSFPFVALNYIIKT